MRDIQPFNGQIWITHANTNNYSDERITAFMKRLYARVASYDKKLNRRISRLVSPRSLAGRKMVRPSSPSWYEPVTHQPKARLWKANRETPLPGWMVAEGYERIKPPRASKTYSADRKRSRLSHAYK